MKNADARISSTADAQTFLTAFAEYGDEAELIHRMTSDRENGEKTIKAALTGHDAWKDPTFVISFVLPMLKKLDAGCLQHGANYEALQKFLCKLFAFEAWRTSLFKLLWDRSLDHSTEEGTQLLGWLVLNVVVGQEDEGRLARKDPFVKQALLLLRDDATPICMKIAHEISIVTGDDIGSASAASSSSVASAFRSGAQNLATLKSKLAGGRHDNDKVNYRDINIVPTPEELQCKEEPLLPRPGDVHNERTLLDRNYRLLREDFLASLRDEMAMLQMPGAAAAAAGGANAAQLQHHRQRTFDGAKVAHYFTGKHTYGALAASFFHAKLHPSHPKHDPKRDASTMITSAYMTVTFQHSPATPKSRTKDWWESKKHALDIRALVCFVRDGKPFAFGQIIERDPITLAHDPPCIGIQPCSSKDAQAMIWEFISKGSFTLLQCDASFFSYEPVLKSLVDMTSVPFADELVNWKAGEIPPPAFESERFARLVINLRAGVSTQSLINSTKANFNLDESQRKAVMIGLTQRVALIQGPPGTGKSLIGALLAKAIFDTTSETILCVCYTNHALDQFLLDLIDHGISQDQVIRVGGGAKVDPALDSTKM